MSDDTEDKGPWFDPARTGIRITANDELIEMRFAVSLTWVLMQPEHARRLAALLLRAANSIDGRIFEIVERKGRVH